MSKLLNEWLAVERVYNWMYANKIKNEQMNERLSEQTNEETNDR